jgi:hypothetical protein
MKRTILIVLLALAFGIAAGTAAEARTYTTSRTYTTDHVESHAAAAEHHHSNVGFALGISSIEPIGLAGETLGSVTGLLQLTGNDAIQLFASIPHTTPGFSFGVGASYKRLLFGTESAGFHLGGGLALGSIGTAGGTDFAMELPALIGVQFNIGNSPIAIHLDGGAAFGIYAPKTGTTVNFAIGQFSSLLGASVVYSIL